MQFELTRELLDEIRDAIEQRNEPVLLELVSELHPADLGEIFNELDTHEAIEFLKFLEATKAGEVLMYMEDSCRDDLLEALSPKEIAEQFIDNLDSDDAADILGYLPEELKTEVISLIEDRDQASDIIDLLQYKEGTAGALMAKELIKVNVNWSVSTSVKEMRKQAEQIEHVYTVYVVDDNNILLGRLPVKKLLITPLKAKIADIYSPEIHSVREEVDDEEVAGIMEKYGLVVVPVVDVDGRLLGRITIDDIVDVIREEADRDFQLASGISENVGYSDSILTLSRARLPWLLIGLVGGILGARVIEIYEVDIQIYPEMAFFIPLITAMAGNVGVQSSAIIVQGLANKSLGMAGIAPRLYKEFTVAIVNGAALSTLILVYNYFFSDSLHLSLTVSIALLSVIIFAALFGTLVPLVLDKYKVDPALATGPFITTVNDILGLFIYFLIGRMMYL